MPYMISQDALKPDQLAAIGHVVAETTYCEEYVARIIWGLCGLDEKQGCVFTNPLRLEKRLDYMASLWKPLLDEKAARTLTALVSALAEANKHRNTIVHGLWRLPSIPLVDAMLGKEYPPAKALKRTKAEPIEFSADKIIHVAEEIAELTHALLLFAEDHGALPSED